TTSSPTDSSAAIRSPIGTNFASRSPTTTAVGIASSPTRRHSGVISPVPMPRIAAASALDDVGWVPGEHWLGAPALDEPLERGPLELVGEAAIGRAARGALGVV